MAGEMDLARAMVVEIQENLRWEMEHAEARQWMIFTLVELGEVDTALDALQEYQNHHNVFGARWMRGSPQLEPLQGHPRFEAIVAADVARTVEVHERYLRGDRL